MTDEIEIVFGPIPPGLGGGVIYSVTLGNGYQVTSPNGFAPDPDSPQPQAVRPLPLSQPPEIGR